MIHRLFLLLQRQNEFHSLQQAGKLCPMNEETQTLEKTNENSIRHQ